jgi:hypothetical protein
MNFSKYIIFNLFLLIFFPACYSQQRDTLVELTAFRPGIWINSHTGETKDFILCGDGLSTDKARFFSMLSGCERNQHLLVGKYSFANDTFVIEPFDFVLESPFVKVYKRKSTKAVQTIRFLSADYKPLNGTDSSWIVRCFKRRKQVYLDFSKNGIVSVDRGEFDGIELLQLTKIFGGPTVMFLNNRFDYTVVVNMPEEPLKRFITGATAVRGKAFVVQGYLYFEGSGDGLKITSEVRKN